MSNFLDHINEDDEIIGQISRKEAHEKDLLHRSVHVFVVNSDNKILVH